MADPTNVELAQWLRRGAPDADAPETHKAWCDIAALRLTDTDALVKALTTAQTAIASLPMEALGYASAENDQAHWPIRDQLLHNINEALAKAATS